MHASVAEHEKLLKGRQNAWESQKGGLSPPSWLALPFPKESRHFQCCGHPDGKVFFIQKGFHPNIKFSLATADSLCDFYWALALSLYYSVSPSFCIIEAKFQYVKSVDTDVPYNLLMLNKCWTCTEVETWYILARTLQREI